MKELTSCFSFLLISLKLYIFSPNLKYCESLMRNKLSKSPIFEKISFSKTQCDENLLISCERYDTGNLSHTHEIIIDQLANRWLIQDANE